MLNGFLLVDKEENMSSYDVIRKLKGVLKESKVKTKIGHTGTLDPFASGLLIILFGKHTRLSDYFMGESKTYRGVFRQGILSDTGDLTGQFTEMPMVDPTLIIDNSQKFIGKSFQVPPAYSALKFQGKKLYEYARKGIRIEKPPRPIEVKDFHIWPLENGDFSFEVTVSSGTYVRTLIEDYLKSLGGAAYLKSLRRTSIGSLTVENAITISEIDMDHLRSHLQQATEHTFPFPVVEITENEKQDLIHGIRIEHGGESQENLWIQYEGKCIALASCQDQVLKTKLFLIEV